MIDIETKKQLANAALKTFDLNNIENLDVNAAISTIEIELEKRLQLNDPQTLNRRHNFFKVPGSVSSDYEERLFNLSSGKSVLAGIRHVGGNIDKPFISLWSDHDFENLGDLKKMYITLKNEFKIFSPKHLSVWVNPNTRFGIDLGSTLTPSLRYVVGSVKKIKSSQIPVLREKVNLTSVEDNTYRGWYEDLYKDFHSKYSEMADWVPVNDKEDMEICLKDKLLFFIYIDNKKAGLIGGRRENLLGKAGVYFTEIVISSEFKGKGYAAAAQRAFIDSLPEGMDLVWGTIDSRNISSTKTALRVGREVVRSEFFVPV